MTNKPIVNWIDYKDLGDIFMSVECKYCGSILPDSHPAVIAQLIEDSVKDWSKFESDHERFGYPVGSVVNVPGINGQVFVESKKIRPTLEDISEGYGHYGESEYPQGTEYSTYIIFRHGDSFFKKTGSGDSYGEITWSGPVRVTKPKEITVTSWE